LPTQAILCVRVETADVLLVRDGERITACELSCLEMSAGRFSDSEAKKR